MSKKEKSLFAMVKPSNSSQTLDQLASDTYPLTQHFSSITAIHDMSSFKLLIKLFEEQCISTREQILCLQEQT